MSVKRNIDILARIRIYRCHLCGEKMQLRQASCVLTPPSNTRFYDLSLTEGTSEDLTVIWDELHCDTCNLSYTPKQYRREKRKEKRALA